MLKINRITKRELALFAMFLAVYSLVLMDKFIQRAYGNFNELEKEIVLTEKKLSYLKSVLEKADEIGSEYEKFFSRQAGMTDSDKLLQRINTLARRLNVNILNIKPSLTKDDQRYKTYSLKVESQDDIATIATLLYALAEEQKNIGVQRLQVKSQGREALPIISLVLEAAVFKD